MTIPPHDPYVDDLLEWMTRPRDKYDDDLPEGSWRYEYLTLVDAVESMVEAVESAIAVAPWWQRPFLRLLWWWNKHRHPLERVR